MSDVPPGPGWWIASDGAWYPPEAHPSVTFPSWSAPPPVGAPPTQYPPPQGPPNHYAPPTQYPPPQTQGPPMQWGAPPPAWGGQPNAWGAPPPAWGGAQPAWGTAPPGYGPPPGAYPMGAPPFLDPVLGLPLAPWWKRLCAILIDDVIVGFAIIVFVAITFAVLGSSVRTGPVNALGTRAVAPAAYLVVYLVAFAAQLVYYGALNGSARGQTVGKMALRIAVRDAQTGGPIGFWRALGRDAILFVFDIPFAIPLIIDYLSPLWDRRRQAWHDKVVRSVVVELPG